VALDWNDLAGTLKQAWGNDPVAATIVNVSPDALVHRGFSMDYQGLAPADRYFLCEPDGLVGLLLEQVAAARPATHADHVAHATGPAPFADLSIRTLAETFNAVAGDRGICLTCVPLGWHGGYRHFHGPLDYIGREGGGGVGAGPGITVGAALALKGTGRLAVGIVGDGDFLMGVTAVWTAVHNRLPSVMIITNNRSFYNDEMHQERVAQARARPV
jgi:hypothetical protein